MKKVLKAWLRKSFMNKEADNYTAHVLIKGNLNAENIVDEIIHEGVDQDREMMLDIVSRFNRKAADLVFCGYNVNTGLVNLQPIITGEFNKTTIGADINSVNVSITLGNDLHRAVAETSLEMLGEQPKAVETSSNAFQSSPNSKTSSLQDLTSN